MKQIEITYHPIRWLRFTRTIKGNYPSQWNDVTTEQFVFFAANGKKELSDIRLLQLMTGLKRRILKKLDNYQRYKLMELVEFVQQSQSHDSFIIPKIKAGGRWFYSPAQRLKGMPFGQFVFVDTLFANYQENKSDSDLFGFMAALYLPEGKKFTEDVVEKNSRMMQQVPVEIRDAIVLNYMMVKEWLSDKYPFIFLRAEEEPEETEKEKQKPRDAMAWIKIFENLVGDDIVNEDKYASIPTHNILRFMSKKIKENLKKKH